MTRIIGVFSHHALTVIDKDFHQEVVNKNANLQIFILCQTGHGKRRFSAAQTHCARLGAKNQRQAVALRVGTDHEAKQLAQHLVAVNGNPDFYRFTHIIY